MSIFLHLRIHACIGAGKHERSITQDASFIHALSIFGNGNESCPSSALFCLGGPRAAKPARAAYVTKYLAQTSNRRKMLFRLANKDATARSMLRALAHTSNALDAAISLDLDRTSEDRTFFQGEKALVDAAFQKVETADRALALHELREEQRLQARVEVGDVILDRGVRRAKKRMALEANAGDELRYELKKAWRDGTRLVRLDPYELLARICAMVPPPWFNMIRFHGVLAPNAKLRELVVASAKPYVPEQENAAPNPLQLPLFGKLFDEPEAAVSHKRRKPWAWLLRHVFAIDVNVCPKCRGRMKWCQVALTQDAIREGLSRAGLSARGPPKRRRVPMGQLSLPFPKMRRNGERATHPA